MTAPVAKVMAKGAQVKAHVDIALAITCAAGDSSPKDVGLVHVATCDRSGRLSHREFRFGKRDRDTLREMASFGALMMLKGEIEGCPSNAERSSPTTLAVEVSEEA